MLNAFVFAGFWLLYAVAQAQNSIRSTSNNLTGWQGLKQYLRLQGVNLVTRAAFSAVFYTSLVEDTTHHLVLIGLTLTSTAVAALAGYSANAGLYQLFGYLPWLRTELHDIVPPSEPANTVVVPVTPPATVVVTPPPENK